MPYANRTYGPCKSIVFAMQVSRSGTLAAASNSGGAAVGNNLASSLRYFHHDHQGSTIAVTNEVGAVIERMAHLCVA